MEMDVIVNHMLIQQISTKEAPGWELCKRLEFDHTTKWYMHKQESVL